MSTFKLTKQEYRHQKSKLDRLEMYLPTLKLKKSLLQSRIAQAERELDDIEAEKNTLRDRLYSFSDLFSIALYTDCIHESFQIDHVDQDIENIAGIEVPVFRSVSLKQVEYSLLDTPIWIDSLINLSREYVTTHVRYSLAYKKFELLSNELRSVSIKVNLFEKKLIPETKKIIKTINVFLGDRAINDIGQLKMAKKKIEDRLKNKD